MPLDHDAAELVREFIEVVVNRGETARADEFLAPTFRDHHPWPCHRGTLEGFKSGLAELRALMPDARWHIDDIETDGGLVSILLTRTGTTHTERDVRLQVVETLRVVDGRIVERWAFTSTGRRA